MKWLEHNKEKWPEHFSRCTVLEVGSLNINGSVRKYFDNCLYLGIDWRDGLCVDEVSLASEFTFNSKFHTIVSCNMLEHDPYWEDSIINMLFLLESGGRIFLEWGGANSPEHFVETAPDGKFHGLEGDKVFNFVSSENLVIEQFYVEADFMRQIGLGDIDLRISESYHILTARKL